MQKTMPLGSSTLDRRGAADLLLLRKLLGIHQKSRGLSFREVIDFFVLLPYANLAASITFSQWLLACLNFSLDSEDSLCW